METSKFDFVEHLSEIDDIIDLLYDVSLSESSGPLDRVVFAAGLTYISNALKIDRSLLYKAIKENDITVLRQIMEEYYR